MKKFIKLKLDFNSERISFLCEDLTEKTINALIDEICNSFRFSKYNLRHMKVKVVLRWSPRLRDLK